MKSIIKKISLFIVLTLIFPIVANAAGGFSVSTRSINLAPNGTKTISISASNAAGRVVISTSDSSIATISSTSEFLDNNSVNVVVTGKRAGVATITVTATDMATYDMEEVKTSYTITVNVTNPQTTTTTTTTTTTKAPVKPVVTPTTQKTTKKTNSPSKKTSTTRKITTSAKATTTTKPVIEEGTTTSVTTTTTTKVHVTEEAKEDPGNEREGIIRLDKFKVVGYELKEENDKYILNIDSRINEIYVLASSKDESVNISGDGIVDIKNKSRIVVEVKRNGIVDKYIIKIQKKQDNSVIIIAALIIIIIGMLIYFIIDWKKNKSYYK